MKIKLTTAGLDNLFYLDDKLIMRSGMRIKCSSYDSDLTYNTFRFSIGQNSKLPQISFKTSNSKFSLIADEVNRSLQAPYFDGYDASSDSYFFVIVNNQVEFDFTEQFEVLGFSDSIIYQVNNSSNDLYAQLIDNSSTEMFLNTFIKNGEITETEKQLEMRNLIEQYNKNVFLKMLNDKEFSSDSSNSNINIDTSSISSAIQNVAIQNKSIADSLKTTVIDEHKDEVNLNIVQAVAELNNTLDDSLNISVKNEKNENVNSNIAQVIENKNLSVINNLDYSDRISSRPRFSNIPDDDFII